MERRVISGAADVLQMRIGAEVLSDGETGNKDASTGRTSRYMWRSSREIVRRRLACETAISVHGPQHPLDGAEVVASPGGGRNEKAPGETEGSVHSVFFKPSNVT